MSSVYTAIYPPSPIPGEYVTYADKTWSTSIQCGNVARRISNRRYDIIKFTKIVCFPSN